MALQDCQGLKTEFYYFHSTNLPKILVLQGVLGLEVEFYFNSTNLTTILAL